MPASQRNDSGYKFTAQPSPISNLRMFVLDQVVSCISVIFPQAKLGLWFLLTGDAFFLIWFIAYPIPLCKAHRSKWLSSLSVTVTRSRLLSGLKPVSHAKLMSFNDTSGLHSRHSRLLFTISTTSMGGAPSTFQQVHSSHVHGGLFYQAIPLSDNSCARALVTH